MEHLPTMRRTTVSRKRDLALPDLLPSWFPPLLAQDRVLYQLWHGYAKPNGVDQSHASYDYMVASYLVPHATDHELALILALRPTGAKERETKGVEYLLQTGNRARENDYRL